MISLTLFGLFIAWFAMLARFPRYVARVKQRQGNAPHYHDYVCGSQERPTWKRKAPGLTRKISGMQ